jgi:hypothetical protein
MTTARRALATAVVLALVAATLSGSPYEGQLASGQSRGITPEQVAPFLGTWMIAMTNPAGAQETVRISQKNGIVAASVQLGKFPPSEITGMVRDGDMLVLTTTRRENGVPIWVVMSLTIDGETMKLAQMLEPSETIKRGPGTRQRD